MGKHFRSEGYVRTRLLCCGGPKICVGGETLQGRTELRIVVKKIDIKAMERYVIYEELLDIYKVDIRAIISGY